MKIYLYISGLLLVINLLSGCENYAAKLEEEKINQRLIKDNLAKLLEEEKFLLLTY